MDTISIPYKNAIDHPVVLRPMPIWMSLLCFGIPSALGWISIYVGFPALSRAGVPAFWNFWLCLSFPLASMLVAALAAYRLEGNPWDWAVIKRRFRLKRMQRQDWLWTLVLVSWIGGYQALRQTLSKWLASLPLFAPPEFLPSIIDPRQAQAAFPTELLGVPLQGAWWVLFVLAGVLFINIIGEELWWRGYILPRQELVHGNHTWWIHGLLWTALHTFWKWDFLSLLPGCLLLSYVVVKRQNTTPAILWHFVNNGLTLIAVLFGILGMGS